MKTFVISARVPDGSEAPRLRRLFQRVASIAKVKQPTAEAIVARYRFWRWNDSTERLLNEHLIGLHNKSFTVE